MEDIKSALEILPKFTVKFEVFVQGFDEILVEDIVTIKISIARHNIEKLREIGLAHSTHFPTLFDERVCILVTKDNRIMYEANVSP